MADETVETVVEEPKETVYSEREWKGLLGDKQNETRARQEAQAKVAQYEVRLAELQSKLEQKESGDTGDPEDVATVALLNKKIDNLEKKLLGMYTNDNVEKSFQKAQDKYTEEKADKGLSFDEVNEGTKRMILKNKLYRDLILNDPNPGEKAYEVGLLDPIIAQRKETYKKTLPPKTPAPKEGLTGTTIPGGFISQEALLKIPKGEIREKYIKDHWEQIEESREKWDK